MPDAMELLHSNLHGVFSERDPRRRWAAIEREVGAVTPLGGIQVTELPTTIETTTPTPRGLEPRYLAGELVAGEDERTRKT